MSKKSGFDYRNLTKFANNLLSVSREREVKAIMDEMVKTFLANAKNLTPVVTGTMREHWDIDNRAYSIQKVSNGYEVTIYNKATNKYGYQYARDVDQGHQSYNQYGGPYVVRHSKYGLNGGAVIGRFIVEDAVSKSEYDLRKEVATQLQKWLDRCVTNAK